MKRPNLNPVGVGKNVHKKISFSEEKHTQDQPSHKHSVSQLWTFMRMLKFSFFEQWLS